MSKTRKVKKVTAGACTYMVGYNQAFPSDSPKVRAAKAKTSSQAQIKMNFKKSCEKLELLLYCNFTEQDYFVTLTYDGEYLPSRKMYADSNVHYFFARLRASRKRRGEPLNYIYVTEGLHGDKRVHHHAIINAAGSYEEVASEIRACWKYGNVADIEHLDMSDAERLAKYLTKEPREYGNYKKSVNSWTPSRGLKRPVTEYYFTETNKGLFAPPGAHILKSEYKKENEFGTYTYLKYLMPDSGTQIGQ